MQLGVKFGWRLVGGKYVIDKDADDVLDYAVGYNGRLPEIDTIASVSTLAEGVVVDRTEISGDGKYVTVWVSGGLPGKQGRVQVSAVTSGATSHPRTIHTNLYFQVR